MGRNPSYASNSGLINYYKLDKEEDERKARKEIFKKNYEFSKVSHIQPSSFEDKQKGIDSWLCIGNSKLPFSCRRYSRAWQVFKTITIRYKVPGEYRTEYNKLLDGTFFPKLYIFTWTNAYLVCNVEDITRCLRDDLFEVFKNEKDGTYGAAILIENLYNPILIETPPILINEED
jgi:hypothetical protein